MKKKHSLKIEIEHDYFLIAIKSVLEDYRLAYFLNKEFDLGFKKENFSLNFKKKEGDFTVFGYDHLTSNCYWSLILNKQVIEKKVNPNIFSLFEEISNTYILIPEEKKTDYFLKIEQSFSKSEKINFIKKINSIHRVITSYEINPNELKSKDFLIF
ncbi:MAG: IPExxxVDY family protein [Flavobacteriaceae bacterium]